jgi:hypothetical protein
MSHPSSDWKAMIIAHRDQARPEPAQGPSSSVRYFGAIIFALRISLPGAGKAGEPDELRIGSLGRPSYDVAGTPAGQAGRIPAGERLRTSPMCRMGSRLDVSPHRVSGGGSPAT